MSTIRVDSATTTLINIFTVEPAQQPQLLEMLEESTRKWISRMRGWISTNLLASRDSTRVIVYSQWRSAEDIEAMRQNPELAPYLKSIGSLAKFESVLCDVADVHPK